MFNFDTEVNDGYTFDGWYKEKECINKWNFTVDALPEKILDENEAVIEKAKSDLAAFINNQQQIVTRSVNTTEDSFSQINQKYNDALNAKLEELNLYIVELQNLISELKKKEREGKEVKDEH